MAVEVALDVYAAAAADPAEAEAEGCFLWTPAPVLLVYFSTMLLMNSSSSGSSSGAMNL